VSLGDASVFDAHVIEVVISTPSDTDDEVEAIKASLLALNTSRGKRDGVVVLPRHWKTDAVPTMSPEGAQGVINKQLIDKADIVVALFDSRLGQATQDAVSGTAHEIKRAAEAGKRVHTWFSDEPIDRHKVDPKELVRLAEYRKSLEDQGLLGSYDSPIDLAHKVRTAIEHDIDEMALGPAQIRQAEVEHAVPRFTSGPKVLYVRNQSANVTAEAFRFRADAGDGELMLHYDSEPFDLLPLADYQWPMMVAGGADKLVITMGWYEDGEQRELTQHVAV
jgi:nucleoside 2-deoxyribosyltransferase